MAKSTEHYDLMIEILTNNQKSQMTGIPPTDSDKELIIQLLQFSGADLSAEQMQLIRTFNFESLTRARRKLQQAGEYLPISHEVWKQRRLKGWELQQVTPSETATGMQRRIEQNT